MKKFNIESQHYLHKSGKSLFHYFRRLLRDSAKGEDGSSIEKLARTHLPYVGGVSDESVGRGRDTSPSIIWSKPVMTKLVSTWPPMSPTGPPSAMPTRAPVVEVADLIASHPCSWWSPVSKIYVHNSFGVADYPSYRPPVLPCSSRNPFGCAAHSRFSRHQLMSFDRPDRELKSRI